MPWGGRARQPRQSARAAVRTRRAGRRPERRPGPPPDRGGRRNGRARMRWQLGRRSENVEDRRDTSAGMGFPGGAGMPGGLGRGLGGGRGGVVRGGGIGGIGLLILLALGWWLGHRPEPSAPELLHRRSLPAGTVALRRAAAGGRSAGGVRLGRARATPRTPGTRSSQQMGRDLREPKLVLFSGAVESACGVASRHGPVLLPRRPEGLHRPRLLRRAARRASGRPATSPRPT